ncbi:MAG: AraC family transcriptional regulator [Lentisphaeria bacterium]|nr:AraC family transcriptional regulator [Lentisphaeria bacterium]
MLNKNPNEEADFTSGRTLCTPDSVPWTQRLSECYGLLLVLNGRGRFAFGENSHMLTAGELVLLKPHFRHFFTPEPGWELLWFHFLARPQLQREHLWHEALPGAGIVRLEGAELECVTEELREAHRLEYERPPGWNPLARLLLETALVRGYNRQAPGTECADARIRLALNLLAGPGAEWSIDRLAAKCGLSRAAFYAKFKAVAGVSPRQYREFTMLRRAALLLENPELSVAEVAERSGMPDAFYFSTRFRKFSGLAPRDYRRRLSEHGEENNPEPR